MGCMDAKLNGGRRFRRHDRRPARGRAAMIGGHMSGSSEVHVMNRFQIIAGRWLAFIILPAAFWGGVALLFF